MHEMISRLDLDTKYHQVHIVQKSGDERRFTKNILATQPSQAVGETRQMTKNTSNLCQLTKNHIAWIFCLHFLQSRVVLPPWRELSSSMLMTTSFSVTKSLQIVLKSAKWPWYIWRLTRANFVMMPPAAVCRGRGRGWCGGNDVK